MAKDKGGGGAGNKATTKQPTPTYGNSWSTPGAYTPPVNPAQGGGNRNNNGNEGGAGVVDNYNYLVNTGQTIANPSAKRPDTGGAGVLANYNNQWQQGNQVQSPPPAPVQPVSPFVRQDRWETDPNKPQAPQFTYGTQQPMVNAGSRGRGSGKSPSLSFTVPAWLDRVGAGLGTFLQGANLNTTGYRGYGQPAPQGAQGGSSPTKWSGYGQPPNTAIGSGTNNGNNRLSGDVRWVQTDKGVQEIPWQPGMLTGSFFSGGNRAATVDQPLYPTGTFFAGGGNKTRGPGLDRPPSYFPSPIPAPTPPIPTKKPPSNTGGGYYRRGGGGGYGGYGGYDSNYAPKWLQNLYSWNFHG